MSITVKEAIAEATAQRKEKVTLEDLGKALGYSKQYIGQIKDKVLDQVQINKIEKKLNVNLTKVNSPINYITLTYRPDVYLSAGYGVEVYNEKAETMTLDARLLVTERGTRINPKNCEIVCVSGNSMFPEYRHGDRVIIDRGDTELVDGHIFAFRYNGDCYVKEINLMGDKLKCISLNKEYDPFYVKKGEDFTVLGRILPRIRL